MDECGDRISGLPDPILHHILSFLPTKQAIQTAVTCKALNQAWTTHPYLDLGEEFFPILPEDESEDEFDLGDEHPPNVHDGAGHPPNVAEHPSNVFDVAEHVLDGAGHPPNVVDGAGHPTDGTEHPPNVLDGDEHVLDGAEHPTDGAQHPTIVLDGAEHPTDGTEHPPIVHDEAEHVLDGAEHPTDGAEHPTHPTDGVEHPTHPTDGAEHHTIVLDGAEDPTDGTEHPPIVLDGAERVLDAAEHPTDGAEHPTIVLDGAEHATDALSTPQMAPNLNNEHPLDIDRGIIIRKRELLFTFVEQTLTRMRIHNIGIQRFCLGGIELDAELVQHLDQWILTLVRTNINELNLGVSHTQHNTWYTLHPIILTASSLRSLTLTRCTIPSGSLHLLRSLRKLILDSVCFDEKFLTGIFNSCHNLEKLVLFHCRGLEKRIHIPAKSQLKLLEIGIDEELEEVVVEAHHLEKFLYSAGCRPTAINLIGNCLGNMSFLRLCGANISNAWFCDLISRLPCLQELHLAQLNLKTIEISSSSLKRLLLFQVFVYKGNRTGEFVINAPNLVQLNYHGYLSCVFQNTLAAKEVNLFIFDLGVSKLTDDQLCNKLMRFLHKFDYSEVVTLDPILFEHMIVPAEMRLNLLAPLTHVKHFHLQGMFHISPINVFARLLESLLWIAPNLDTLSLKDKESMEVYPIDLKLISELIAGRCDCPSLEKLKRLTPGGADIVRTIVKNAMHVDTLGTIEEEASRR